MLCTGTKSEMAHLWARWLPNPCRLGGPQCSAWGQIQMAHMWAQWLPNPCHLGGPQCSAWGQNQKWPTCGHSGYLTPPVWGSPMLCMGTKSEMAHMWAQWLPNPCRLGGPQCSARGRNQKWPTCGHCGYLTLALSGVPNALHGDKIRNGPHVGGVAT